jgi:hypothetical protein
MIKAATAPTNPFDALWNAGESMRRALGMVLLGWSAAFRSRATSSSTS